MSDRYAFIHVHTEAVVAIVRASTRREAVGYFTAAAHKGHPIETGPLQREAGIVFFCPSRLGDNFLVRIQRENDRAPLAAPLQ